ncbi:hypothetical protein BDZ97DRAFT_1672928, partial [Flammula alnicola]
TAYYEDTKAERQRKTRFWLSTSLMLVSRQLYIASVHAVRSTYLPVYQATIRSGYSSDPFPVGLTPTFHLPQISTAPCRPMSLRHLHRHRTPKPIPPTPPLLTPHCEIPVLDRFILLKVCQDVFTDESELHMDREDAFQDLFDVARPLARLEDLVRIYGVREGIVSTQPSSLSIGRLQQQNLNPLPFPSLSISFSPRRIGLVLNGGRTIAEIARVPRKKVLAWGLVRELKVVLGPS